MIDHAPGFASLFLSAELAGLDRFEQVDRTERLAIALRQSGMMFDRVAGQYQGTHEASFRVCLNMGSLNARAFEWDTTLRLAREYGQESILIVLSCGAVYLQPAGSDLTPTFLGQWSRLRVDELDGRDYSAIGGEYFAVRAPS